MKPDLNYTKKHNKLYPGTAKVQYTVIILLCVISLYSFLQSPFFAVNKIYVLGSEKVAVNQILAMAKVQPGVNILKIRSGDVEKTLTTHHWIKRVTVEKKLPATIKITVEERQGKAILLAEEGYVVVDETGAALKKIDNLAEVVLPVITNVLLEENLSVGERVKNEAVITALEIISSLPEKIKERTSEVSLESGVTLFFVGGLEIRMGSGENLPEKINTLASIFANTDEGVLKQIKYIDLRFYGPPVIKYKQ